MTANGGFVCEYVVDLRGADAAIRAGIAKTRPEARKNAHLYRHRQHVADAIARLIEERTGVTRLRVVEEVNRLVFSTISDVLEIKNGQLVVKDHAQLTEDQLAAVASVEEVIARKGRTLRVKQHDKISALTLLAKLMGINSDRLEVSGPGGSPIAVDHTLGTARERIAAKLDAIAGRLPEEPPIPLRRVGAVYQPD
jgi:hypothetical protein